MICRSENLRRYPTVFVAMTGLRLGEFDQLVVDMLPELKAAEIARLQGPQRRRAVGGGRHAELNATNHLLLTVLWLRQYPTNEVLGFLFGVSDSTVSRVIARVLPLLEANGKATMRLLDPGCKCRKELDALLEETSTLAMIIDTFEQRVQRHKKRSTADTYFSGKKQQMLKSQVAVNKETGEVCDVAESVESATADITVVKDIHLLARLPEGVVRLATWPTWVWPTCIRADKQPHHVANRLEKTIHLRSVPSTALLPNGASA